MAKRENSTGYLTPNLVFHAFELSFHGLSFIIYLLFWLLFLLLACMPRLMYCYAYKNGELKNDSMCARTNEKYRETRDVVVGRCNACTQKSHALSNEHLLHTCTSHTRTHEIGL